MRLRSASWRFGVWPSTTMTPLALRRASELVSPEKRNRPVLIRWAASGFGTASGPRCAGDADGVTTQHVVANSTARQWLPGRRTFLNMQFRSGGEGAVTRRSVVSRGLAETTAGRRRPYFLMR